MINRPCPELPLAESSNPALPTEEVNWRDQFEAACGLGASAARKFQPSLTYRRGKLERSVRRGVRTRGLVDLAGKILADRSRLESEVEILRRVRDRARRDWEQWNADKAELLRQGGELELIRRQLSEARGCFESERARLNSEASARIRDSELARQETSFFRDRNIELQSRLGNVSKAASQAQVARQAAEGELDALRARFAQEESRHKEVLESAQAEMGGLRDQLTRVPAVRNRAFAFGYGAGVLGLRDHLRSVPGADLDNLGQDLLSPGSADFDRADVIGREEMPDVFAASPLPQPRPDSPPAPQG